MNNSSNNFPRLSERETELLFLISRELSNAEIADLLYLSKNTIDSHKKNLYLKLNVTNSAGLVRRSYELGLLPMDKPASLAEVNLIES